MFLFLFCPTQECSLLWKRHQCRWRTATFDLYSALMAIMQWVFFSFTNCDKGHLFSRLSSKTRYTGTCCAAFVSGAAKTCYTDIGVSRPNIEPRSPACEVNAVPLNHVQQWFVKSNWIKCDQLRFFHKIPPLIKICFS